MNHEQLDRLLCVRLGIAPISPSRHDYWDDRGNRIGCKCGAEWFDRRPLGEECPVNRGVYPKLSTTGEGMLVLMEVLRAQGHSWVVEGDGYGLCRGKVQLGPLSPVMGDRTDSAPLALALAAANALEIKVPA